MGHPVHVTLILINYNTTLMMTHCTQKLHSAYSHTSVYGIYTSRATASVHIWSENLVLRTHHRIVVNTDQ